MSKSTRVVASLVGMSHTWVANEAKKSGIKLKNNFAPLSPAKRKQLAKVLDEGATVLEAAQAVGCSTSTVNRHQKSQEKGASPSQIQFVRSNRSRRCPVHGRVNIWPCVACVAENG